MKLANLLAGNFEEPETSAVLEFTLKGGEIRFTSDEIIALAGGDMKPCVNGNPVPMEEHRICYGISTSRSYLIPENWEDLLDKESESLKQRGSLVSPAQITYMREEMLTQVGVEIVPDLRSYFADGNSCYMISVHTFDPEVIIKVREFISGFDNVTALLSTDHTVDIIGRNCSKAAALKYLTQLRHLSRENVASIGDGMNDISMLRESAVAMQGWKRIDARFWAAPRRLSEFIADWKVQRP